VLDWRKWHDIVGVSYTYGYCGESNLQDDAGAHQILICHRCGLPTYTYAGTQVRGGPLGRAVAHVEQCTSMICMRTHVSADPLGAQQRQCGRGTEVHWVGCPHNFSETWISKGVTWQALVDTARNSLTTPFRSPHRSQLEHAKGDTND